MASNEMWIELMSIIKSDGAELEVSKVFPKEAFLEIDNEMPLVSDVNFSGRINNLSGSLFLKGVAEFTLMHSCDRCLKEYSESYSISIEDVIAREQDGYEADEYIPYSGSRVLLTDAIYKEIYPIILDKHLCKEDCKGLCSMCGCDLNEKSCDCEYTEIDPRLEKLKDFFKD